MLNFKKEKQLYKPIENFLKNRKYSYVHSELGFYEYKIDLFGYSKSSYKTISVELKLKNWQKALQQSLIYQLCSDYVYIAMPKSFLHTKAVDEISKCGIGIISVYPSGYCKTVLGSQESPVVQHQYKTWFIENINWERVK